MVPVSIVPLFHCPPFRPFIAFIHRMQGRERECAPTQGPDPHRLPTARRPLRRQSDAKER